MQILTTRLAAVSVTALALVSVAACGGGNANTSPAATAGQTTAATTADTTPKSPTTAATSKSSSGNVAAIDPCSLLKDSEVAELAPGVRPGKLDTVPGSTRVCDWLDSHGVPEVQLSVSPAPSSSLREELNSDLNAFGGYTIIAVDGLGDEAEAAFQKPDPSKGITSALGGLLARSGSRVVSLSTPDVPTADSKAFALAKQLVAKAISRLPPSG